MITRLVKCLLTVSEITERVSMTKKLRRTDTGDIAETAVMSEAERQGSLL